MIRKGREGRFFNAEMRVPPQIGVGETTLFYRFPALLLSKALSSSLITPRMPS